MYPRTTDGRPYIVYLLIGCDQAGQGSTEDIYIGGVKNRVLRGMDAAQVQAQAPLPVEGEKFFPYLDPFDSISEVPEPGMEIQK